MDYVPCQYMYSILKITVKNYFKRMRILYVLAWTMTQYKIKGGGEISCQTGLEHYSIGNILKEIYCL